MIFLTVKALLDFFLQSSTPSPPSPSKVNGPPLRWLLWRRDWMIQHTYARASKVNHASIQNEIYLWRTRGGPTRTSWQFFGFAPVGVRDWLSLGHRCCMILDALKGEQHDKSNLQAQLRHSLQKQTPHFLRGGAPGHYVINTHISVATWKNTNLNHSSTVP